MTSNDQAADNTITPCHAPWRDNAEIVAEVDALHRRFSASDLCLGDVLCDDHPAGNTAFTLVDGDLNVEHLSFGELADQSRRLASALADRGIGKGARVGVLMAKTRQMPVVALALWRPGAVYIPLFTAFAGQSIAQRVEPAGAQLIICDSDQRAKLADIDIPVLESGAGLDELIASHQPLEQSVAVGGNGPFIQIYTSGTTGAPKGNAVPAFAVAAFIAYMRYGFDMAADDVFWNMADPGWAYGLYYAVVGPMAMGYPNVLLSSGFNPQLAQQVIEKTGVTNLASAPTVFRALKKDGIRLNKPLRAASSAGEPLTPDVTGWAPDALGSEVRDHWGQTEFGMGIINSWDARLRRPVKPNSMGQAMPGFVAGTVGEGIALSVDESPLLFWTEYVDEPEKTRSRYTEDGKWYLSGDAGRHDGTDFFFSSRDDDLIIASGYRISPFDIESIIASDSEISEAAVVGRRYEGEVSGEVIEAFVVLNADAPSDDLEKRLQDLVRNQYGKHGYPRSVHPVDSLPKTPSGKVRRVALRGLSQAEVSGMSKA